MHGDPAAACGRFDRGVERPGRVVATVDFCSFETHVSRHVVAGADHTQPLRSGEGTHPGPEGDRPCIAVSGRRFGPGDLVEPLGIAAEVGHDGVQMLGGGRGVGAGAAIHDLQCGGRSLGCVNPRTIGLDPPLDPAAIGIRSGTLWAGEQVRLAGIGTAGRVVVERPGGAPAAQQALADLAGSGPAGTPGRGVVGFGAFPFDRGAPGELVVPEVIVGRDADGSGWLTALDGDTDDARARCEEILDSPVGVRPRAPRVESMRSPAEWRDTAVARAVERIAAGALRKVVLARELRVTATEPIATPAVLAGLVERFPSTAVFAVDGFIGASPELLVGRSDTVVRAHPLAGTAARRTDPAADAVVAADLLASTKDQWEHRITIDWLLDTLLPFCSYVDAEPEPTIVSLANVHHLGTRVEGVLSRPAASILELVAALHPTPAVGGDPQATALELIGELEGGDRGRYAGPVGWVDAGGNGAFAVGIRSAQIEGNCARLWAGVGVVADSDPVAELAETEAKLQAMLSVLTD